MRSKRKTKLGVEFFRRDDTLTIARELLGKVLVVPASDGTPVSGVIVETEAYRGVVDRAAHSFGGRRTARNEVTYGPGGYVYVFFVYGMYHQLNFVTNGVDIPEVVLIRALRPIEGIEVMRDRRRTEKDTALASGPGKLCIALGIDHSLNGAEIGSELIRVEDRGIEISDGQIAAGKRIGIDYAGDDAERPWRFWIDGDPNVSRKR